MRNTLGSGLSRAVWMEAMYQVHIRVCKDMCEDDVHREKWFTGMDVCFARRQLEGYHHDEVVAQLTKMHIERYKEIQEGFCRKFEGIGKVPKQKRPDSK